jgi:hypothetical protein
MELLITGVAIVGGLWALMWALREYTRQLHSTRVHQAAGVYLSLAGAAFTLASTMAAPWWLLVAGIAFVVWGAKISGPRSGRSSTAR